MSCFVVSYEKYYALYNTLNNIKAPSGDMGSHELHQTLSNCIYDIEKNKLYSKSDNPLFAWVHDLALKNEDAHNQRYGLNDNPDGFVFKVYEKMSPLEPMHLYKLLRCIDYQCDQEGAAYLNSCAKKVMHTVLNQLAHYLVKQTIDYHNAPWG